MDRVLGGALAPHRWLSLVLALGVVIAALAAAPAEAAPPKPRGLKVTAVATSPVLSWRPVPRASEYRVQVSHSSSFATVLWDSTTVNVRSTPTGTLPLGRLHWRVQAVTASGTSGWAGGRFVRSARSGPSLVGPSSGVELQQPEDPPVLRWEPVPGARSYVVEIDGAEKDWVDVETYTTETTSTVVNEPQPVGTYWWRVHAVLGNDVNTRYSEARSYTLLPLRPVSLRDVDRVQPMEDVVLGWDPVPGAVAYEIRVSTDNGFNTITDQRLLSGTRYSPPVTYDNAAYWWQVRAVDALGNREEWPSYPVRTGEFRRAWLLAPQLQHPTAGASVGQDDLFFEWAPVRLASRYALDFSTDPGFAVGVSTCVTTQTTYTPRWSDRSECMPAKSGTYFWRVRALDDPGSRNQAVNSLISEPREFTFAPTGVTAGTVGPVSGQRVLLSGSGAAPCGTALPAVCTDVRATPVFDWDPVPGATSYRLYLSHDVNFTNMVDGYGSAAEVGSLPATQNTRWVAKSALPDTQAGEAYYWFVRACGAGASPCGPMPRQASHAFRKKSAAVEQTAPTPGASVADQVTFVWRDYLETNLSLPSGALGDVGERPEQAGRQYRVQVSDTATFSKLIDNQLVDQTTYTAFDRHYPEGELFWRVQAVDGAGNGLTWSEARPFTHTSPSPVPISPSAGEAVSAVQPFRWQPLDYAKYYDIEVYRNADTTASSGNLAAEGYNLRQTAFTWDEPLQSLGKDMVWRVRRTDYSGNKSAWGPWQRFRVRAAAPRLVSPRPNARMDSRRAYFSWRASPQAASYRMELRHGADGYEASTVGTAYAAVSDLPAGRWTWRVVGLDSRGQTVSATGWSKFRLR
ncbi:hypothetical protein [Nocardioides ferulae]|uniref:hypothetical protein n=1 Tax=Nocardioides ferulae TaxID=2340821 RepID=UPI000EAB49C1|nr:hypothetical protein [Nocardioides ferulae]